MSRLDKQFYKEYNEAVKHKGKMSMEDRIRQVKNALMVYKACKKIPKKYFPGDWYEYIKDTARRIYLKSDGGYKQNTGLSYENYEQLARFKKDNENIRFNVTKRFLFTVLKPIED